MISVTIRLHPSINYVYYCLQMCALGKFQLTIMDPDCILYKKEITSLFAASTGGEFELLAYHYPALCLLRENSDLIIDWKEFMTVRKGILRFFKNDCVLIVELLEDFQAYYPDLFLK